MASTYYVQHVKLTTHTLESLVNVVLASSEKIFIVLDALDESTLREAVLAWIRKMSNVDNVQMIYTSREVADFIDSVPVLIGRKCCLSMDQRAIDTDISSYVKGTLESDDRFTSKRLPQRLKDHIQNKVGIKANGMFRWAACQLDTLARCVNPRELERDLDRLPRDLSETYERMLKRIPKGFKGDVVRLLQFIVYAEQPPTLQQVIEIIATYIDEDPPHFYADCRLFNSTEILHHCKSLVSVVEVEYYDDVRQEIHLAHFSVKEYLLGQSVFDRMTASIAITKTCLTYLTDIEGHRWSLAKNFPMALYASMTWFDFASTADASADVSARIVKFLQNKETFLRWKYFYSGSEYDYEEFWESFPDSPLGPSLHSACLGGLALAIRSILDQGASINARSRYSPEILHTAISGGSPQTIELILDQIPDVGAGGGRIGSALLMASGRGDLEVVKLLLKKNADVNAQGGRYWTALQAACAGGHDKIVRTLLENGADVHIQGGQHGNALVAAASSGDVEIVELMLGAGIDINGEGGKTGNALHVASRNGHLDVVRLLLQAGADINAQVGHYGYALTAASVYSHVDVVRLLLDNKANVAAKGGFYGTPLQAAACAGNEEIIELLLGLQVDANEEGGEYGSALQAACAVPSGHDGSIVRLLLDRGASVNAQGGRYGNALLAAFFWGNHSFIDILMKYGADASTLQVVENHINLLSMACAEGCLEFVKILPDFGVHIDVPQDALDELLESASMFGHVEVVKVLIGLGANVNAQGCNEFDNALCAACKGDSQEVVLLLLESGADINLGGESSTALRCAASIGKRVLVEMLLDLNADVNAPGPGSDNALLAASDKGHVSIVRMLLDNGARTETADDDGWTPLSAASSNGHDEVVKLLIERGADTNYTCKRALTPLLAASWYGHVGVMKLLLECGVDPDHRHSGPGRTALFYAAEAGHQSAVELLLADPRVNPHSEDSIDRTPLFLACE